MKKIAFMTQIITLIIALPLLTVLEINHVSGKTPVKSKVSTAAPVSSANNKSIYKLS